MIEWLLVKKDEQMHVVGGDSPGLIAEYNIFSPNWQDLDVRYV